MADAMPADGPAVGRTWSASNLLQSFSEAAAAVQPLPANLGRLVEDLQTALASPSKLDLLQPSDGATEQDGAVPVTWTRPVAIVVPESGDPCLPNGVGSPGSPPSQLHSFATKHSASSLSALSAAAASLKDKTHQVAQQQKRALSAFQQNGGLVGWLHGEMEASDNHGVGQSLLGMPASPATPTPPSTPRTILDSPAFDLCPPQRSRSPFDSLKTKQPAGGISTGRRRSMPNIGSGSLLNNLFDKVSGVAISPDDPPQGHSREKLYPTTATTTCPPSSFDNFLNRQQAGSPTFHPKTQETVRQRAATTDLPSRSPLYTDLGDDDSTPPALLKARSAASLHPPRPPPETWFSLDDVLSDEWSCTVLWAHLYSTAGERDHQHHLRLSFLIETTFQITPLYQNLAGADTICSDNQEGNKKLVARLKRLHHRFLMHNGAASLATSGVPVASPAASRAKNQLALAVHTLTDQRAPDNELLVGPQVEKAMSALLQLAREVEREFRVLGTRSYTTFADTALYRGFIAREPGPRNIAVLLRAAHIPFYQQPNDTVDAVCLSSLATEEETPRTVFPRAGCQVFTIAVQPDGSINFTDILPGVNDASSAAESIARHAMLQQTVEPFLNPSANVCPAATKPLAFNFIAGTGSNAFYGAVMWLPVGWNNVLGTQTIPGGVCIISKFPLVDTMRQFLSSLWKLLRDKIEVSDGEMSAVSPMEVVNGSQEMGEYFLAHLREISSERQDGDLLPTIDFRLSDLFDCLSLANVLRLFAFVLLEKKIVLVASSYTVLFSVGEALRTLIHPLVWSHIYVPVLPLALKDCLQCPTPFIFGLHDSYVRRSDMPRPSSDLVVVNLDRDALTGGGDIFLPPLRHSMLREELFRICKPHIISRDSVDNFAADSKSTKMSPSIAIRRVFCKHLREMLALLEPCINRFDLDGQNIAVVNNVQSSQWPADTARFCSAILQTQAVATYLASPRSNEKANVERVFV